MIPMYAGTPENTCPPGTGSTFTEELGRHCVNLFTPAPDTLSALATTGGSVEVGGWITAGLLLVAGAILVWYNATKRKED